MIINVKKYLFVGAKEELDQFFSRAQQQGFIEFLSISGKKPVDLPPSVQNLMAAIKILRKQPLKKAYTGAQDHDYALVCAERILQLKADVEKMEEEMRLLEGEISRVSPFGDFNMDDIEYIEREGARKIQFFCMKTAKAHKTNFTEEVLYIGNEYDLDYFVTINDGARSYPQMIEMRIDRPLGELQSHLSFIKDTCHQMEAELKGFAGHIDFLRETLIEELNHYYLSHVKKEASFPMESSLFAIEGWVPSNKTSSLLALLDGMAVHGEEIAQETEDRIPTYMENRGVNRIGEDLVHIYDVPATSDKDPSGWVFWSFVFFFSMIIADGGYGLLFLALAGFLKYKIPKMKGQGKRFFKLFVILASTCILWGILTDSYFGLDRHPTGTTSKVSLLTYLAERKADYHIEAKDQVHEEMIHRFPSSAVAKEGKQLIAEKDIFDEFCDNILFEFSLLVGVIHVSLSLIRYLGRNWAGLGWIIFLVGSYLYFPFTLHATSLIQFLGLVNKTTAGQVGIQLIYIGIGLSVFLAFVQKRLKGLGEIMNVIQVFGDVLSYLRLYALSLAGSIMAETFNTMGTKLGLAIGVLIILLGHSVNILLSIMSGVIHGLRLNFIEWYHYSFDGGGKLFNPLKKLKKGA